MKNAPRNGSSASPSTVKRSETPNKNRSEGVPKTKALICAVKNVVKAMANILITTPLITWSALKRMQSTSMDDGKSHTSKHRKDQSNIKQLLGIEFRKVID